MSIWSKVFIGLVMVSAMVYLVLAALTLNLHKSYRELANRTERDLQQQETTNENLRRTGTDGRSVAELESTLDQVIVGRGRVWSEIQPAGTQVNPENGQVRITMMVGKPTPSQLAEGMLLFLLEAPQPDHTPRYLGQFTVATVNEQNVELTSALTLNKAEISRLQEGKGPWQAYEQMPADSHALFAGLTEEQKRAMLPATSVEEFLRDGQASAPNDPPDRVAEGKYRRSLRDYLLLFTEYLRQRTVRGDEIAASRAELDSLEKAVADAKRQVAFHEAQIAAARADLAQLERERDAVAAHRQALETQLQTTERSVAALLQGNRKLAAQLAARQIEALRQADELTGATP